MKAGYFRDSASLGVKVCKTESHPLSVTLDVQRQSQPSVHNNHLDEGGLGDLAATSFIRRNLDNVRICSWLAPSEFFCVGFGVFEEFSHLT
jgi:hypothetical protein